MLNYLFFGKFYLPSLRLSTFFLEVSWGGKGLFVNSSVFPLGFVESVNSAGGGVSTALDDRAYSSSTFPTSEIFIHQVPPTPIEHDAFLPLLSLDFPQKTGGELLQRTSPRTGTPLLGETPPWHLQRRAAAGLRPLERWQRRRQQERWYGCFRLWRHL